MKMLIVLSALFAAACVGEPKTETNAEAEPREPELDEVSVTFPDGTVTTNVGDFEAAAASQTPNIEEMQSFELKLTDPNKDAGAGIGIGNFRIQIVPDMSYLRECVQASILHLKVAIINAKVPAALLELHLVAWFQSGKPCFSVVNTGAIGYGWCQKYCVSAPKAPLKNSLKAGLISAGVSTSVAAIISALIAPVAMTALAL